jgi:hypothetical protein
MQWEFIIALLIAIPVILFPVALIWYMNMRGIYTGIRRGARENTSVFSNRDLVVRNPGLVVAEKEHSEHNIK